MAKKKAKKLKFQRVDGSRVRAEDAQAMGETLEQLFAERGSLTWADVFAHARKKTSPFHRYFTWNVRKAAEERWEEQGRHILRSIEVVYDDRPPVRYAVHIQTETVSGYFSHPDVISDDDYREIYVGRALKELEVWAARYAKIVASSGADADVKAILRKMRKILGQAA